MTDFCSFLTHRTKLGYFSFSKYPAFILFSIEFPRSLEGRGNSIEKSSHFRYTQLNSRFSLQQIFDLLLFGVKVSRRSQQLVTVRWSYLYRRGRASFQYFMQCLINEFNFDRFRSAASSCSWRRSELSTFLERHNKKHLV